MKKGKRGRSGSANKTQTPVVSVANTQLMGSFSMVGDCQIILDTYGPDSRLIIKQVSLEQGTLGARGSVYFELEGNTIPFLPEIASIILRKEPEPILEKLLLDLMTCGSDSEEFKILYPQLLDEIAKLRHSLEQAEDLADLLQERLIGELTLEHLPVDIQGPPLDDKR